MPLRKDRDSWSPAEDAYLREMVERVGASTTKIQAQWPTTFPRRSLAAIRVRKAHLRLHTRPDPLMHQPGVELPKAVTPEQTLDVRDTGDSLVVTSLGSQVRTLDELVARAKIDLTKYEVDRPETSMYETTARDDAGKLRKVQNFRIVARFRLKAGPSTQEQVEALIAGAFRTRKQSLQVRSATQKTHTRRKGADDLMQAVCIADPHIGKLAWEKETGQPNWDTAIAVETLRAGVTHLVTEGDRRDIAERRFVLLGDYFQHDGRGMTTKGTVVDYDSRVKKMLQEGTELLFDLIAHSAEKIPTKVYIVPGNHDKILSYALQLLLQTEFRKHPRVTIDDDAKTTKFMTWGKCLIGMDHGDRGKTRLPAHMASACEIEWGQTTYREILTGHLHSKAMLQTINGILVRTMDALCSPDAWHVEEKFSTAFRSIESLTYHSGGMCAHTDVWSPDLNRAPRKGSV